MTRMRKLLVCSALMVCAWLPSRSVQAYAEGPWCVKASVGNGTVTEICHYGSFEACRNQRGAWGNAAFCVQNPRFLPYWKDRGFEQEPHRARLKKHRRR